MTAERTDSFRCTYLLPIRRVHVHCQELQELSLYIRELGQAGCEVIVVDGSPPAVLAQHNRAWADLCHHVTVDPKYTYLNGKVNGVLTGLQLASCEKILLADDDIRYSSDDIRRTNDLLDCHEMVRPQNYISPLPWWGRTEMARMLINRGTLRTGDYPGTCAFRRSTFMRIGHYDGDVLFDNEEIVRHFLLSRADVCNALGLFILKRPPSFQKWLEQRPRQAYEDLPMYFKTILFMSLLPVAIMLGTISGGRAVAGYLLLLTVCSMLFAFRGLLRNKAYKFFPASVIFFAPPWVLERALSVYWALYWRTFYGGYPFGERLLKKSTGRAWFAARAATRGHPPITN